jgi:ABC-type multidrug transport system ATPase subunit
VVRGLSFAYGSQRIFQDFAFEPHSHITVLTGPSGSGKTTLLKLLSRTLVPDKAEHMPPVSDACLILQEDGLLPWLTGIGNITAFAGCTSAEMTRHPLFPVVEPFLSSKVHRLSFGQRRLIELFRALLKVPEYLYLDEPLNFLDDQKRTLVLNVLRDCYGSFGNLVLSTHHRDETAGLDGTVYRVDGTFPITAIQEG